jgi:ABC-2 type transport system ATP-binding protein
MNKEVFISVENLSRHYGPIQAVHNINFEVCRGEVLGFLGPNGAGKSTTMKMLSGNLAPSAGRIRINGIDILDQPKLAKAQLGYLPEQPPVYKELTTDEYLVYTARINRIPGNKLYKAVQTAKERCGLGDVGKRLIGNLSKGYQQRVGIAQAIIHSPPVVILDEPTVGLDPIQIREIRALIRELEGEHSVILSTHILPEVQTTCDRVQIINKGELVLNDTIDGLAKRMQGSSLLVRLLSAPELQELSAISGIKHIDVLNENRYRIHFDPNDDPTEVLVKTSVEKNWALRELTPERMTLEEIFVDITTEDTAHMAEQKMAAGEV